MHRFRRHKDLLSNGLRLVTVELPHLHSTSIVMYAKVGSRYETATSNGLSHFLEHMLFRGTTRLPDAYRMNYAIEELGGTLYAETGRDYSLYQLSLHPSNLAEGLALFGEIFRTPVFEGIDIERRIVLEEILEDLDEDGREINIDDLGRAAAFPGHPLGYKITGPYRNVERFSVEDVRRHFRHYYGARNMVLTVSGACQRSLVRRHAERHFSALPRGRQWHVAPPPDGQHRARFRFVENAGSQTSVQLIFRAFPESSPDFPALQLLSRVLDDGLSTRLHRRVCDELGLAYYLSGNIEVFIDAALFEVNATCAHANVVPLVEETLRLCSEVGRTPPSAAEMDKAKRRFRWDLEASFDDPDRMAGWWGGTELFFPAPRFEDRIARLEAVEPADICRTAARVFRPDRMTHVQLGLADRKLEAEVRALARRLVS